MRIVSLIAAAILLVLLGIGPELHPAAVFADLEKPTLAPPATQREWPTKIGLDTATPTLPATLTSTRSSTPTGTSSATTTSTRTGTPTPTRTETPVTPGPTSSPTPTPSSGATATATQTAGPPTEGICSQAIHDQYTTTGPDGQIYPTWHPARDPSGCYFNHEHGDDPRSSLSNPTLPAFGYYDHRTEPHNGFKVAVMNAGEIGQFGTASIDSHRVVLHMGTGAPARFDTRNHSFQVDAVGAITIHTGGMGDTGPVGSFCSFPGYPSRIVRVAYGCELGILSSYEYWTVTLGGSWVQGPSAGMAVEDPITVMDPGNHALLELTGGRGCHRLLYFGPYGPSYIATYQSDGTPLVGIYSTLRDYCTPGIGLGN